MVTTCSRTSSKAVFRDRGQSGRENVTKTITPVLIIEGLVPTLRSLPGWFEEVDPCGLLRPTVAAGFRHSGGETTQSTQFFKRPLAWEEFTIDLPGWIPTNLFGLA